MNQRVIPPPGTPAAELARLSDEESGLAEREADILQQGGSVEMRARDVQCQLDEVRAALQRLAATGQRGEAEKAFLDSLGLVVPAHHATPETTRALELRRKALIARLQALEAEGGQVRARSLRLGEISEAIARLQMQAAGLAARAEAERLAPPPPEPEPILLTVAPRPAAPRPAATTLQQAAHAPQQRAAVPAKPAQPAAWSLRPSPKELIGGPRAPIPAPPPRPPVPAPVAAPMAPVAARPQDLKETRASARMKVHAEVTLASESNFFTGFSGDLSEGGLFVATYEKLLSAGTQVDIALALPGRPALKLQGTVKWVRDTMDQAPGIFPGMGIAFDTVNAEALASIKTFLTKREPMFWDE